MGKQWPLIYYEIGDMSLVTSSGWWNSFQPNVSMHLCRHATHVTSLSGKQRPLIACDSGKSQVDMRLELKIIIM